MVNILKIGNAIVIDFTDNDKYLHNGTIEVAPNELMVVIDKSDMATFKKMSNGDTLFGLLINLIQIQGEAVTKDNIIDKFGIIGFTSGGGGGTGGAVDSVNGLTGDVIITAKGLGAISKTDADAAYASKEELANKADTSTVEALNGEVDNKLDTLVSGTNIKTVNGLSILGEGNIEISGGGGTIAVDAELSETSENPVQNKVITDALNGKQAAGDYALKSEAATKSELALTNAELEHKADKTSVYTIQEVDNKLAAKQATLIQGTNITLSEPDAEGKVTISASQPDITGLATKAEVTEGLATKLDTSTYNGEKADFALKSEIPDTSGLATKEEISDMETKTNAASTYATIQSVEDVSGEVATLSTDKQDNLVSGTNIKTINGESVLGTGDIEISSGGPVDTEMSDTSENAVQNKVIKAYIDSLVGNILTQLLEVNGTN